MTDLQNQGEKFDRSTTFIMISIEKLFVTGTGCRFQIALFCCYSVALLTSTKFGSNSVPVANNYTAARYDCREHKQTQSFFVIVLRSVENFLVALIEVVAQ